MACVWVVAAAVYGGASLATATSSLASTLQLSGIIIGTSIQDKIYMSIITNLTVLLCPLCLCRYTGISAGAEQINIARRHSLTSTKIKSWTTQRGQGENSYN